MNIYVETNFVLELALEQEQRGSCEQILIDSADDEAKRFDATRSRLLKISEIIPLTAQILGEVARNQKVHDLSPQDALVYTSILQHLKQGVSAQGCFLNKDRDFNDPDIVEELSTYNCKLLPRFDSGYQFILHAISQASPF